MRCTCLCIIIALALLVSPTASAYQWYRVAPDTIDHPVYDIQFGHGLCYAATEEGVFRGPGMIPGWEKMGDIFPAIPARSIVAHQGTGWHKEVIDDSLPGATGIGIGQISDLGWPEIVVTAMGPGNTVVWYEKALAGPGGARWGRETVATTAPGAREVSLGDIDGDGDQDAAVALRDADMIVWYENTLPGPAVDWPMHVIGPLSGPRGVFIADVNNDTFKDVVAGGMPDGDVVWFEAPPDPTGLWTIHTVDDSLAGVKGVYAIDLDGDLDLDIIAGGRDANDLVWYEQDSSGVQPAWTKHYIDSELAGVVSVWAGDLIGDESPEVAATAKLAGQVVVYEQPGEPGGPWFKTIVDDALTEACPITAADFDQDGTTDIAAAGRAASTVAWYKTPSALGRSWVKTVVDDAAGNCMGLYAGDLDGDGDPDLAATAREDGLVHVYTNDRNELYCAFADSLGHSWSCGVYRWSEVAGTWQPTWYCQRPYFIVEHPLIPGIYYCGNQLGLHISVDMMNWAELGAGVLPDTVTCCWFHPADPEMYMVGTNSGVYRTTDGGVNWSGTLGLPDLTVEDIDHGTTPLTLDPMLFAAVGNGSYSDGVFRSDDYGATWERILFWGLPTDLLQDSVRSDQEHAVMFLASVGYGVHRMDDEGGIVGELNTDIPGLDVHCVRYDPYIDTPAIFGCTDGGLGECLLLEWSDVPDGDAGTCPLCSVSPNPWSSKVAFSLAGLRAGDRATVSVYDVAGREVWRWIGTAAERGDVVARWDGRDGAGRPVAAGVYFYRAEGSGRTSEGKLVRLQ